MELLTASCAELQPTPGEKSVSKRHQNSKVTTGTDAVLDMESLIRTSREQDKLTKSKRHQRLRSEQRPKGSELVCMVVCGCMQRHDSRLKVEGGVLLVGWLIILRLVV